MKYLKFSNWQDGIIFFGQIILALTLIPTIVGGVSMPYATSIPALVVMFAFAYTFWSLKLYSSMASSIASAAMWLLLVVNH